MRTKQEIDADYTNHAFMLGHKTRILCQIQDEIETHKAKLIEINSEGMALPKEEAKLESVPARPEGTVA